MIKDTLITLLKMIGFTLLCAIPAGVLILVALLFGLIPFLILCVLLVLCVWVYFAYEITRMNKESKH